MSLKTRIKKIVEIVFNVNITRMPGNLVGKIHLASKNWDYKVVDNFWIGGKYSVSNHASGYHGILKQWWDYYNSGNECLLVTENNKVKSEFILNYPSWKFKTLDYYDNKGEPVDIIADLCGEKIINSRSGFDLIICQATLEHLYNPFQAMKNMISLLNPNGVLVIHTHVPGFPYHPYPRDYLRYHPDWFEDIQLFIEECELLELYTVGGHIFSAYKKK